MQYHEAANIFPMMNDDDLVCLTEDIKVNGQREPIWIHDGKILDGRNRHKACEALGITPTFKTWDGTGSLISFVVSLNLRRRHLTSSQQAMIAQEVLPMLEDEAKERQRWTPTNRELIPYSRDGKATEHAASLFNTNPRYVQDAKRIKESAPDLAKKVKAGDITLPQAKRELTYREKKEAPELPSDKYRVVYADPPWSYGNTGLDDYGHAERHYPSMTIEELCEMDIKNIIDENAVLFMWVTSPLLEECFPVIKAWGFKYKTSFVWDKVGHNYGHYNSVRHELLLVCTRGSCTPDNKKLFDSVQSIEKSNKHSEKPEKFRAIIDELYDHGKKIELFSRTTSPGWEGWGNE